MKLHKSINKVDTKKKALKLIYDPVCLLRLLYSKYGDIEEDYNCLQINQLLYEASSHYAVIFKEFEFIGNFDEYLKRWYTKHESVNRMPKINDYYKNYHKFFCKPNFSDFTIGNIMQTYGDEKAELYYKDNFGVSNSEKEDDISRKNNSNSFSSLDNITNNKIIFDDKNKFLIEKNEKSINYSMSMNLNNTTINSLNNKNKNLANTIRTNDSLEEIVHNLVHYKKKKEKKHKKQNKNKYNKNNKSKKNNKNEVIKINNYQPKKIITKMSRIEDKTKKNKINSKERKIKTYNSNNIVKIKQFIGDNNVLKSIFKVFNSPQNIIKRNSQKTKFEDFNTNNQQNKKNSTNILHQRNKTYTLNNYSGMISLYDNGVQNLSNSKFLRKTTSQNKAQFNSILTFKDLIEKQNPKKKNKTFDSISLLKNQMISASSNIKVYNRFKSNQNIIGINSKNNNYIGSKFNLVKNVKNINFAKIKNKKQTSYNYYQNILNKIMPKKEGNKYINNNNCKNVTSFGQNNINTSHSPQKNKSISPINSNKDSKIYNNLNDIKNRNKLAKNQINNYNINFNNVFLTSSKPNSYVIDNNNNNINTNTNINSISNKNSNNSHVYSSINVIKNMNNNSINNNLSNNNFIYSNILDHENKANKNLYVMNLKNLYNVSRNKNNILINNNPLTQTESHHSKIQNNYNIIHIQKNNYNINKIKETKVIFDKMNYKGGIEDSAYVLNSNINNNSKSQNKNKSRRKIKEAQKISNEINNFIKKTQFNFNMRNKNKNFEIFKASKLLNTGDEMNKKKLKNNKSFNCSKNTFSSSSVSRRKNKSRINKNVYNKALNVNVNKVSSLTSQKNIKSKHKRKIK